MGQSPPSITNTKVKPHNRPSRSPLKSSQHSNRVAPLNAKGLQCPEKQPPNSAPEQTSSESKTRNGFILNGTFKHVSYSNSNFEKYLVHTAKLNSKAKKTKKRAQRAKLDRYKDLRDSSSSNSPGAVFSDPGSKSPAVLPSSIMPVYMKPKIKKDSMPLHLESTVSLFYLILYINPTYYNW